MIRNKLPILGANTQLLAFSIVTYAVSPARLSHHLPPGRFRPRTIEISGSNHALVSAVTFHDHNFQFPNICKNSKFRFWQTNYRAYVIDELDGKDKAWFFGTTLGSIAVIVPAFAWGLPWHYARYRHRINHGSWMITSRSAWASAVVDISPSGFGESIPGFSSRQQAQEVLTNPSEGWYRHKSGSLGTYKIWHPPMGLRHARPNKLSFSLFEKLGLVHPKDMMAPHSILISPKIEFDIHLPPRRSAMPN